MDPALAALFSFFLALSCVVVVSVVWDWVTE